MTIVEAIQTAKVGQKVKRAGRGTVAFVKNNKATVKLTDADYKATDWVVSVPEKKKTIKTPILTGEKVKVYKAIYITA